MFIEIFLFCFVISADLLTKHYIMPVIFNSDIIVLEKIFTFTYVENYGASFGIFSNQQSFLSGITAIFCTCIFAYLIYDRIVIKNTKNRKCIRYGLILILSGGIANLYDRLKFGYVRDFIKYDFIETIINNSFAVGNIADLFLLVGLLLLISGMFFSLIKSETQKPIPQKEFN